MEADKDPGGGRLINAHGYSSQEIVNLLLTGIGSTNTFNGDETLGDGAEKKMVLKGIYRRSDIGLLSLFEHYDCFKVSKTKYLLKKIQLTFSLILYPKIHQKLLIINY